MKRVTLGSAVIALACLWAADVLAAELPRELRYDHRVRSVAYNPDEVVNIAGALMTTTQIEFAHDERIVVATVGNNAWESVVKENFLFLKPRDVVPLTNMNIVTTRVRVVGDKEVVERRSYQLALAVMARGVADKPFFLVRFQYPTDEQRKRQVEASARAAEEKVKETTRVLDAAERNGPRNWAYSAQGEAPIEPLHVWDDGKTTTMVFKGNTEMPAIYLEREGKEELVPKSVHGDRIKIHAIGRKFVLRRGDEVVCIFNEHYVPEGVATGTMTVSPRVDREVLTKAAPKSAFSTKVIPSVPLPAGPVSLPAGAAMVPAGAAKR